MIPSEQRRAIRPLTQSEGKERHEKVVNAFTIRSAQVLAAALIKDIGIDTPVLDAQLILAHVLQKTRLDIQLHGHQSLSDDEVTLFWQMVGRRLLFEPIAYILGSKEFYGSEFAVSKDCLIPRPDTEVVVEQCLELIAKDGKNIVFDLCTGSGAIAITLLLERPHIILEASDISEAALKLADHNAHKLSVKERLVLRQGDLFEPFLPGVKAHLIVANPPYIAPDKIPQLSPSVRDHEPRLALDAGDALGISFYQRILDAAPAYLCSEGYLVMEIGFDQAHDIEQLIGPLWLSFRFFKDLASNTRGIVLQKK